MNAVTFASDERLAEMLKIVIARTARARTRSLEDVIKEIAGHLQIHECSKCHNLDVEGVINLDTGRYKPQEQLKKRFLPLHSRPKNYLKAWGEAETERLDVLVGQGKSLKELATALERSESSIYRKMWEIGSLAVYHKHHPKSRAGRKKAVAT